MREPIRWGKLTGTLLLCAASIVAAYFSYRHSYPMPKGSGPRPKFPPLKPDPLSIVSGVVLDPQGKPAPGVDVYMILVGVSDSSRPKTVSDSQGHFSLQSFHRQKVSLYARKGQDSTVTLQTIVTGDPATLKIVSDPLARIAGTVVDTRNAPVAGVVLTLYLDNTIAPLGTVLTDGSGHFLFDGVVPGARYFLEVARTGYGYGQVLPAFPVGIRQKRLLKPVVIPKADSFVSGIVVDRNGKPVAGAELWTLQVSGTSARSDRQGRFRLSPVLKGMVQIEVRHPSFGEEQVDSGTTNARVVLQ